MTANSNGMRDREYVRQLLATDYATEFSHERPYPPLKELIHSTEFDYLRGKVAGEASNGSKSREGHPYLQLQCSDKFILSHRFIVAVTLGKWAPRECDIDHINHNPSDNRPVNLRITTRRDNAGNRRQALLSELADVAQVGVVQRELAEKRLADIAEKTPKTPKPVSGPRRTQEHLSKAVPKPLPMVARVEEDPKFAWLRTPSGEPKLASEYTGETKPGNSGGIYRKTTSGSWHYDPTTPEEEDIPW